MNYTTTGLYIFKAKAETKIVELGEELIRQLTYGNAEDCLLDKIELLSYILDSLEQTINQEEIDKLVYFALDYFELASTTYSPFDSSETKIIKESIYISVPTGSVSNDGLYSINGGNSTQNNYHPSVRD